VIKITLIAIASMIPLTMMFGRWLPRSISDPLAWPVFLWMAVMLYLLLGLVATEPIRLLVRFAGVDEERRQLLSRSLAVLIGGGAISAVTLGVKNALAALHVKEVSFTLDRLPKALDGLRIVQLTDIHVGPTIGREFIQQMVSTANGLNPDIIAVTGDLVDGSVEKLSHSVAPLADLKARFGTYFVTGNHEYYSDAEAWITKISSLGLRVLRNEHVTVGEGEASLHIAGVDDYDSHRFGHEPSVKNAVYGRHPEKTVLLLAHQPRAFAEAIVHEVDLTLSGHTHAGQMWPWNHAVKVQTEYIVGSFQRGLSQLYVSPGTGYWGPPVRVGTQAEITLITLRSKA
jgi:predicted MPP superfamily phosphohydrolase